MDSIDDIGPATGINNNKNNENQLSPTTNSSSAAVGEKDVCLTTTATMVSIPLPSSSCIPPSCVLSAEFEKMPQWQQELIMRKKHVSKKIGDSTYNSNMVATQPSTNTATTTVAAGIFHFVLSRPLYAIFLLFCYTYFYACKFYKCVWSGATHLHSTLFCLV